MDPEGPATQPGEQHPAVTRRRQVQQQEQPGGAAAAPAEAQQGQEEHDRQLWKDFTLERQAQLASHDRLAALGFLAMHATAAWRLTQEDYTFNGPEALLTVFIVLLAIMVAAGSAEYVGRRRWALAVLRLAGAFSPIFDAHAKFMMQNTQEDVKARWGLVRAVARILYGDHCTLLAYLCLAFHIDGMLDLAVQAIALATMMQHNQLVCNSPYLQSLQAVSGMGDLHRWLKAGARALVIPVHRSFYKLGRVEVCKLYVSVLQVLSGCLAPMLFHYCNHATHAMSYARQHGISPDNRHFRRLRFVHCRLCTLPYLLARWISVLPISAGVVALMSYAPPMPPPVSPPSQG